MKFYPSGTQLGNYEIVIGPGERPSLLGGMGIVYLGFDRHDGRPVALKTFQPQFLPDRNARERFLREGQAWVQLERHPHIVHCLQVEHFRHDQVYLVLEQIAPDPAHSGASLRDWLPPGSSGLPLPTALLFALQVVRGMAYAVEQLPGFVHRDLKPGNILVGADQLPEYGVNRVRVTDFGLATTLANSVLSASTTSPPVATGATSTWGHTVLTRGWVGTPLYMAPEQWRREPCTTVTDIYALGLILQEMLSGRPAIMGRSLPELQAAHEQGIREPLPTDTPAAVAALITRFTAPHPTARYQTWAEVEAALLDVYTTTSDQPAPAMAGAADLSRAERLARGWSQNSLGLSYRDIGRLRQAATLFAQGTALGEELADRALQVAGLGNLGLTYRQLGDARRAIGCFEQCLAIEREVGDRGGEGRTSGNLGLAYGELGDVRRAIGYLEQGHAIARETGDRVREGIALGNLGFLYTDMGDTRQAIGYHEQHLAIARETGDRVREGQALAGLGSAYQESGDARQAIGYFEEWLATARETGDRFSEGNALSKLGVAFQESGDGRLAIGYLEQSLTIAQEIGDRAAQRLGLARLGAIYTLLGDMWRAIGYLEQALAIARETGNRIGEAIGQFNIAVVYGQEGRQTEAVAAAEVAMRLFQQIGNTAYAQQAAQLLAQLRGGSSGSGPTTAQVPANFQPLIEAVIAAAHGQPQARQDVEAAFEQLTSKGWQIADPVQRIWAGERDVTKLTAGVDPNSALIIQNILQRLQE